MSTTSDSTDWFIERCPECGSWNDVTSSVFEHYGCVTCAVRNDLIDN